MISRQSAFLRSAATSALAAFALCAPSVHAQTGSTDPEPGYDAADIIVTGTRIARPDLTSSSPVAVIDNKQIKNANTVTVEQLLSVNPQFVGSNTSASNNPGDGTATVDLRGLGSFRTLVLIDGKRAPYYDTQGSVDVNSIPTALLKRIDVLTGGASAVYGSDAVAGVVNFILDDRFVGLSADASTSLTRYNDGAQHDFSLTGGLKLGDRGNFVVSGSYSKREGIKYAARPRNSVAIDSSDLVSLAGSSNTNPTVFDFPDGSQLQVTPAGGLTPDLSLYNFTPVNYAQVPFERYTALALGRYELTDGIEVYGRANYAHTKVLLTLAPTATAGYTFNIDPSNPFLSPAQQAAFFGPGAQINDGSGVATDPTARAGTSVIGIRRRITETPGRVEPYTTNSYQFVGGFRGDIGTSLKWDVFAQYGKVTRRLELLNDLSYSALAQALDVVSGPNGPVCFDPSNGCVPLNLFGTTPIPASQLAFVIKDGSERTTIKQFVAGGNISGDVPFLKSPFASGPAAFSAGVEYRSEKGSTLVDSAYASGDLIYYGQGQNITGKYHVAEIYGELKVPIVQDKPFINSLNLETGYRYSDYSTAGSVSSYKLGGDWAPEEGFRLRGIYQRAVRAPNIFELFSPVVGGTGSLNTDPCAGPTVTPTSTIGLICIAQGAPIGAIGNIQNPISGQINIFTGGNPNLKAEKTDTYTFGIVINPPSLRGLTAAVDYFDINIANAIDDVPPAITVAQCFYVDQNPSSPACSSIHRNGSGALSGNLQFGVPQVTGNLASIKTRGVDVSVGYTGGRPDGFNYSVSLAGTYTISYTKKSDPTVAAVQCAGRFGSSCNLEPIAKWKHVAQVMLGYDKFSFVGRWRYLGSVKQDVGTDILQSRIPAFSYFDTTFGVNIADTFGIRFGIQNVFDKKSPIVGDTVGNDYIAGSTFPNTYDVIGRSYFIGATAKF